MPSLNGSTRYLTLREAAPQILDADLLLFRGTGWLSKAIRVAGRSAHSHAAKASWHNGTLMCLETREFHGGRMVTLASQVCQYPGQIDVFRANAHSRWPLYSRAAADAYMTSLAGRKYGWFNILRSLLLHLPVVRWKVTPPTHDDVFDDWSPYCSAACAMADDWGGGVDVVPNLANWAIEPGDLARSLFYEYLCTLVPDVEVPSALAPDSKLP